ncbi:LysR substrate-binding domain-containing protein [Zobellella maritima]|uniref:LysR substrate-binding domain-containing protein n=1 Tax=Zobellella maritima TaxID=2059725 RepID=UPI000E305CA6|nr:LysR substrate-binding domain-containing protein [Zobellella maritima]
METKWLHDFVVLVEQGNFSKAAEARNVTQPAFSRRIRSLENWLGVPLVNRHRYPMTLTKAGDAFVDQARILLSQIYGIKDQLRQTSNAYQSLRFIAQPSLAVSFFPAWLHGLRPRFGDCMVSLNTGHYHDAVEQFLAGSVDFLLCFCGPGTDSPLSRQEIERIHVGQDRLVPVSMPDSEGRPRHAPNRDTPLKLLTYPKDAYLGELIQRECLNSLGEQNYQPVCENALGEGLKAQALQGDGAAWLPAGLVQREIEQGQLVILPTLPAPVLDITLYRMHPPRSEEAGQFWHYVLEQVSDTTG